MKKCPKCGVEIEGIFCPECGYKISEPDGTPKADSHIIVPTEYPATRNTTSNTIDFTESIEKKGDFLIKLFGPFIKSFFSLFETKKGAIFALIIIAALLLDCLVFCIYSNVVMKNKSRQISGINTSENYSYTEQSDNNANNAYNATDYDYSEDTSSEYYDTDNAQNNNLSEESNYYSDSYSQEEYGSPAEEIIDSYSQEEYEPPAEEIIDSYLPITGISASSILDNDDSKYGPLNAIDGDTSTAWVEGASDVGIGEYLTAYFDDNYIITGIEILPGYMKTEDLFYKNSMPTELELGTEYEFTKVNLSTFTPVFNNPIPQYFSIDYPIYTENSCVGIYISTVRAGNKYQDTCITEIRFIGHKY